MSEHVQIVQVDAFTHVPFAGNPAGVCVLDRPRADAWLQAVAREMNLSETAFLWPRADDAFDLRWFTPTMEVPLCGHATLASAHHLSESGTVPPGTAIDFHTRSGVLEALPEHGWIRLDFPAFIVRPTDAPEGLADILGAKPVAVAVDETGFLLVELASPDAVRTLRPDISRLARQTSGHVIVTSRAAAPDVDFVSRFFGPASGVDEDPVTGAAHCRLAPYWGARLGKEEMVAHQVSARGGVLRVRPRGGRVHLLGQAVTVLRGTLTC
jgi:PhzF family phenazine biosynthesis protein